MSFSDVLGAVSILLAVIGYAPYLWATMRGSIRPHAFSWLIWGISNAIAFAAQSVEGAGAGAWVTGTTAILCFLVAMCAFFRAGEKDIHRSDWISFAGAIFAALIWVMTDNPLLSIIVVTLIDALGFYPSFRKGWNKPGEDMIFPFACASLKFGLAIAAMDSLSASTLLFPVYQVAMNAGFAGMILMRRHALKASAAPARTR